MSAENMPDVMRFEKAARDKCNELGGDSVTLNGDSEHKIRVLPAPTEWLQARASAEFSTYGDYVDLLRQAIASTAATAAIST
jgi:hypothetical protein